MPPSPPPLQDGAFPRGRTASDPAESVLVALHEEGLIRGRLGTGHVLPEVGLGVGLRACLQLVLSGLQVLCLALPRLEGGLLEGAAVREGERPADERTRKDKAGSGTDEQITRR